MRAECIDAVQKAIGRSLKQGEATDIEQRLKDTMRELARKDPDNWRTLNTADRMALAADQAANQLVAEGAKKRQRVALTIQAHDKVMNRYGELQQKGMKPFSAIGRILENAEAYSKGVAKEYFSNLIDTINAVDTRFLGMVEDAGSVRSFVREVMGESTGDARAAKAAKAWLDTTEAMRQRFNRAGGDVGKLDYGYLPQPHNQVAVLKAGVDKWVGDVMPKIDRRRYVNEDGSLMDDATIREMLTRAFETISTGGLNKMEVGRATGNGSRANRGSDHRAIHFKDSDAYFDYMAEYAKGGVFDAMQGHVGRLAKDIALVEEMGPNPETMFRYLQDTAKKTGESDLIGPWLVTSNNMWDSLSGKTGIPANARLADLGQGIRNVQVFGKLQSAMLSSVTDIPSYFATTLFNRLPLFDSMKILVQSFGKESKEFANRGGLIADSIVSDMNRWAEGNIGAGWTGKLANATMKASLLEAWTDATRRAFGVAMMGGLGKMSRQDWGQLHKRDRSHLQAKGVTEQDFNIWKLATPEDWRGAQMLTPESIRAIPASVLDANKFNVRDVDRAVSKMLAYIADESEFASLAQDLGTRAAVQRGTQRGTVEGETLRSLMLFKGFPMSMISRHWGRVADTWRDGDQALATGYAAGLTTSLTIFGALAVQLKDMANGKDPRDMTTGKFWGAALAQSGGAGILGDVLYTGLGGQTRSGAPNWTSLVGPVFGDVGDAANLVLDNVGEAARGEDTHFGAEAFRFTRGHLPFVNLWYAKTVLDRAVLNDIQEYLSPGYSGRMRGLAKKDWGQEYWLAPGDSFSDARLPDAGAAFGDK